MSASTWVIFDGDNTLWDVEQLYDKSRQSLCAWLEKNGVASDVSEAFQRAADVKLFEALGYAKERFPLSFQQTLNEFLPNCDDTMRRHVESIAQSVFSDEAPAADGVDEVLKQFAKTHRLGLITAGEPEIQRRRLAQFGRADLFSATSIVKRKSAAVLTDFLAEHQIDPAAAWMIGDSLNSDIIPAVTIGMRAIQIVSRNWHPVENGASSLPYGAYSANNLHDALRTVREPT